jgi:predicted alpha-1,2-mannosidase
MKPNLSTLFLLFGITLSSPLSAQDAASFVNPMIGTAGMGHCFPGACAPFGIVQLSPETDTIPHSINGRYVGKVYEYCAGYQYEDKTIVGFSHTHLSGTGHSDLGDIMVMPQTGALKLNPGTAENPDGGYRQRFSHDTEKASAGYYEVTLQDQNIRCQFTATPRVGVHKYTFQKGDNQRIILDMLHGIYNYDGKVLWSSIRVEDEYTLTGHRITNGWARENYTYFAIRFNKPIVNYGYKDIKRQPYYGFMRKMDIYHNFPEIAGRDVVAYFDFDNASETLEMEVALSAASSEGALKNLKAEATGTFDELYAHTLKSWNDELGQIECEGTDDEKAMLYTSFYHTMINPSVYQDVDGQYRGLDGNIHKADGFTNYTVFSLWDTFRAEHPLLVLLKPQRDQDMIESMLKHQQQNVHKILPIWSLMGNEGWCMTGYHAVSAVADAIVKGLKVDYKSALEAMHSTANCSYMPSLKSYIEKGYCPYDHDGTAASNTLEYSYDDFSIYAAEKYLGKLDTSTVASDYAKRALYYRNTIDPAKGFASPRYADGSFKKDLDPYQTYNEGFIEGNSWNFSFTAPHDVFGLMKCLGGEKTFIKKLDQLFAMDLPEKYYADNEDITADCLVGGYVHGNEPSHHIPYLYAWTAQPWKTQQWLRTIIDKMYKNKVRGLGGNDDCGQMSAWYIFSVMGFYPVCPGTDQYVLGAPYLPYMKVRLDNGKYIEIKAPKVSDTNRYVKSVKLNGKPYSKMYITHTDLLQGAVLEFEMSPTPNKHRGTKAEDKPYSMTR